MKTAFRLFLFIAVAGTFQLGTMAHAEVSVVSFQAWKTSRIEETRGTLEKLQQQEKTASGKKADVKSALVAKNLKSDPKFQQAQLNLEIAQELTVNDYFILYLTQFNQREAFVEAARKLSAEESADLMMSYQKTISGPQQESVRPPTASAP